MIDFVTVVEPVLEKYCVVCHGGPNPKGGCDLSGDKTRLFNMAYDNLLGRSASYRQHNLTTGRMLSQEAARGRPLVHFYWLRRSPTAVNRPLWSGSYVSRLVDYLDASHCGQDIPTQDRQRIAIWIDANVPYYSTWDMSRPWSTGGRDATTIPPPADGKRTRPKPAPWVNKLKKICAEKKIRLDARSLNFTNPQWTPDFVRLLAKSAGGAADDKTARFKSTKDPDYQAILKVLNEAKTTLLAHPRIDMPDAKAIPQPREFGRVY